MTEPRLGLQSKILGVLAPFLLLGIHETVAPVELSGLQGTELPVELVTPGGTVYGSLLLPSGDGPYPVSLIIAGSGPTDRNGNSAALPGPNNSLRLLAEALAERGIATLRYDKRGIGESAAAAQQESALRFDTYVEDAAGWVQQLSEDARFSTVSIIGHSEGSLIGIVAASRVLPDGIISVAGAARPAPDLLREQLRPQLPPELWEASERILTSLIGGNTTEEVPPPLFALYRPSVQPYLISWFRFNPAEELARLDFPVLIVHGTTDIQVSVGDAHLLHMAKPDAGFVLIEGMNHILKSVPLDLAQQQSSYSDPRLPVVPEMVEEVSTFVRALDVRPGVP